MYMNITVEPIVRYLCSSVTAVVFSDDVSSPIVNVVHPTVDAFSETYM